MTGSMVSKTRIVRGRPATGSMWMACALPIVGLALTLYGALGTLAWSQLYNRLVGGNVIKLYQMAYTVGIHSHFVDRGFMAVGVLGMLLTASSIGAVFPALGRWRLTTCAAVGATGALTYLLIVYLQQPEVVACF